MDAQEELSMAEKRRENEQERGHEQVEWNVIGWMDEENEAKKRVKEHQWKAEKKHIEKRAKWRNK